MFTATGIDVTKSNGGTESNAMQGVYPKPDDDTGNSGSDEPDCGVYVDVNVYVLFCDKCCTRRFPPVFDSDPSCHWEYIIYLPQ